jgi:hypothetical protein
MYYKNLRFDATDIFKYTKKQRTSFEIQVLAGFASYLGCKALQIYDPATEKYVPCCIEFQDGAYPCQNLVGIMSLEEVLATGESKATVMTIDELGRSELKLVKDRKRRMKNLNLVKEFLTRFVGLASEEVDTLIEIYRSKASDNLSLSSLYSKSFSVQYISSYTLPNLKLAIDGVIKDGECSRCWLQKKLKIKEVCHLVINGPKPSAPPQADVMKLYELPRANE